MTRRIGIALMVIAVLSAPGWAALPSENNRGLSLEMSSIDVWSASSSSNNHGHLLHANGPFHTCVDSTNNRGLALFMGSLAPATDTPTVTTQAVGDIGTTTATGNGNITDLGTPNPTAHGVCWDTAGNPTLADNSADEGAASATGAFTSNMTGLSPNTTYYVRAYATNTAGTSYGNEVNFTTDPQAPTVTTQAVSNITTTTATGNGNITDLGGPNPTAHGVVWNTTGTPTLADSSTNEGAAGSTGPFTSDITGLSPNTTYYVRAYAINTVGTAYGNEVNFTTKADSDGDGLSDALENNWCTDPNDADTDNDGIIDGVEEWSGGCQP
jgi:hypothetical protein